jgi:hypothetical protein
MERFTIKKIKVNKGYKYILDRIFEIPSSDTESEDEMSKNIARLF